MDEQYLEVIQKLRDGNMLSQPGVRFHMNRALATGDCSKLLEYLERHPSTLAAAERNILFAVQQRAECPYRPYPDPQDVQEYLSGSLKLGFVNDLDDMFGIDWDILSMPVINAGRVGSGKSILAKYLLCQMVRKKRPFNVIIPDLKKEYRDLLPYCRTLKVLTKDHIRFNPFEVPLWSNPKDHSMRVARIFVSENYLIATSMNELIKVIQWLYKKRGVFDGGKKYPTFLDVYKAVGARLRASKWGRYVDVLRWLENRLFPYTQSPTFCCLSGIPFDCLKNNNLVLEMDMGFTGHMYNFTVAYIADLLYSYNIEHGFIGSKLRHLFNVDEARILFNAYRDSSRFGESILNEIVSKSREFGIGFFLSSQESASFNQTIRSLAFLKIAFPLNDAKDLEFIQESFGLDDEQKAYLFRLPRYGRAVVRYSGYEMPFLLQVPHFKIRRHLTNEVVQKRMNTFYQKLRSQIKPIAGVQLIGDLILIPPPEVIGVCFFLDLEPFTKVSMIAKKSTVKSQSKVNNALKWLHDYKYIRYKEFRLSKTKTGRKSKFAILTDKAHRDFGTKRPRGKGGFEHAMYQHLIHRQLTLAGTEAFIEGILEESHKLIDVLARTTDDNHTAYEVTGCLDNLVSNIRQDFDAGADKVVIVITDPNNMKKARKKVAKDFSLDSVRDQIAFQPVSDFFD